MAGMTPAYARMQYRHQPRWAQMVLDGKPLFKLLVLPHLAGHESSMRSSFTRSHAVPVAGKQVASLGQALPQAVAMQRHLRVGTAAEVPAAGLDTSW